MEYYKMVLEDVLKKIFPDTIIELTHYPEVGRWPYILDTHANQVEDQVIANALVEYIRKSEDREEKRSLLIALNYCLTTYTHPNIFQELFQ